jgi:hypothetical protein
VLLLLVLLLSLLLRDVLDLPNLLLLLRQGTLLQPVAGRAAGAEAADGPLLAPVTVAAVLALLLPFWGLSSSLTGSLCSMVLKVLP